MEYNPFGPRWALNNVIYMYQCIKTYNYENSKLYVTHLARVTELESGRSCSAPCDQPHIFRPHAHFVCLRGKLLVAHICIALAAPAPSSRATNWRWVMRPVICALPLTKSARAKSGHLPRAERRGAHAHVYRGTKQLIQRVLRHIGRLQGARVAVHHA